jgi:hypothetical protein
MTHFNSSKITFAIVVATTCLTFNFSKISATTVTQTVSQTPDNNIQMETDSTEPEVEMESDMTLPTDTDSATPDVDVQDNNTSPIQTESISRRTTLKFIALAPNNTLLNISSRGIFKSVRVTGINGNLQGIDFRPANNQLYGVTDTDNLYIINFNTGRAKFVSKLSSSFDGGFQSGFDFNPVPDRLRTVGSNDQNFRTNVDNGQVNVDKPLAYDPMDANTGIDPNITAIAYTNSVAGAKSTQLFGIDYNLDTLVLQDPPNDGNLKTIGKLGINFAPIGGFDIITDTRGNNIAFAISGSTLYNIDLSTGAAKKIVEIPKGSFTGLAVTSRN